MPSLPPNPDVLYHCPHSNPSSSSSLSGPPLEFPPHPSTSTQTHPLQSLYFCEECDAIRCDSCIVTEISCYYCPHCLFEVPNASVRAELNRCARNCFICPHCTNTLSVNASDPTPPVTASPLSSSFPNQPPPEPSVSYHLSCNYCKWSSAETGIVFDKPTGVALQLQKMEESASDNLEFERLREHLEPHLRPSPIAGSSSSSSSSRRHSSRPNPSSSILAASSALHRHEPSIRSSSKSSSSRSSHHHHHSRPGEPEKDTDHVPEYEARGSARSLGEETTAASLGEEDQLAWMAMSETLDGVASLESRWTGGWGQSIRALDLKPQRTPLSSKQTKRCATCRHILIKPEQKAQSIRYKIKLLAAAYVPTIEVVRRSERERALGGAGGIGSDGRGSMRRGGTSRTAPGASGSVEEDIKGDFMQGGSYPFHLVFVNPLFDPISITLEVQVPLQSQSESQSQSSSSPSPRFQLSLPLTQFPVSPFADPWEYAAADDPDSTNPSLTQTIVRDDVDALLEGTSAQEKRASLHAMGIGVQSVGLGLAKGGLGLGKRGVGGAGASGSTMGKGGEGGERGGSGGGQVLLEKKGNISKIGMDLVVGKDAEGGIAQFNLRVSFTYRSDDDPDGDLTASRAPPPPPTPSRQLSSVSAASSDKRKSSSSGQSTDAHEGGMKGGAGEEEEEDPGLKRFTFDTVVTLGRIREKPEVVADDGETKGEMS